MYIKMICILIYGYYSFSTLVASYIRLMGTRILMMGTRILLMGTRIYIVISDWTIQTSIANFFGDRGGLNYKRGKNRRQITTINMSSINTYYYIQNRREGRDREKMSSLPWRNADSTASKEKAFKSTKTSQFQIKQQYILINTIQKIFKVEKTTMDGDGRNFATKQKNLLNIFQTLYELCLRKVWREKRYSDMTYSKKISESESKINFLSYDIGIRMRENFKV